MASDTPGQRPNGPDAAMEDEEAYQRQLCLFTRSCAEKGAELVKIGEILGGLPRRRRFLDIGAGAGDLTIPLSGSFAHTTIVEPNSRQVDGLRARRPEFDCLCAAWDEADLGGRRFDLILCSHMLYYLCHDAWGASVAKMHDCLEPGGRMVLVMQSPLGETADFFRAFTNSDAPILDLWRELEALHGEDNLDVRCFVNDIRTPSLDEMTEIGLFLLCDRRFRERRAEIAAYFDDRHKVPGGYRLTQDEIVLSLKKPL